MLGPNLRCVGIQVDGSMLWRHREVVVGIRSFEMLLWTIKRQAAPKFAARHLGRSMPQKVEQEGHPRVLLHLV